MFTDTKIGLYKMLYKAQSSQRSFLIFAMSGLLGGLAEIVWMYAYNLNNTIGLKEISNEIVKTLHIAFPNHYLGLIIHLSLSVLIGAASGKLIFTKLCKNNAILIMLSSLLMLSCIWMCTFKLILPIINADMANIVPEPISFISKMLFGICMALSYSLFISKEKRSK